MDNTVAKVILALIALVGVASLSLAIRLKISKNRNTTKITQKNISTGDNSPVVGRDFKN